MLEKKIKFVDYNGTSREETHYFNISKAELIKMESSTAGGMKQRLEKIVETQDEVAIMETFTDLIHRSYGEKSPDGRRFIKSEELSTAFEQTEAYTELVMEILGDSGKASEFINSILPKEAIGSMQKGIVSPVISKS